MEPVLVVQSEAALTCVMSIRFTLYLSPFQA